MAKEKIGLLVMAYGTPYSTSDVKRYYTHIRNGREPSEEQLKLLIERYDAIGGVSPMAKITEQQAKGLEEALNEMDLQYEFKLYIGLRHIDPFIEDTIEQMAKDNIKKAVTIILTPHYSNYSIEGYNGRAQEEANKYGIKLLSIESWYDEQQFIQYWADEINRLANEMTPEQREKAVLLFTAHSLPKRIVKEDDPYIKQLHETGRLIAEQTVISDYEIAWQSAGNSTIPWLDPDVFTLTETLFNEKSYRTFVYCPVGFVSDHLEILYDNDYECKEVCDKLGASYFRPNMPNANELFINGLASAVLKRIGISKND